MAYTTYPTDAGIYRISFVGTQYYYWGKSNDLGRRKTTHLSKLRKGDHSNPFMQDVFNKYGEQAFTFERVILCTPEMSTEIEQKLLEKFVGEPWCMNISKDSLAPMLGRTHTEEAKVKIGQASLGNQHTLGKPRSTETKAKISQNNAGSREYGFVSPDGVLYTGRGVLAFALGHGLDPSMMIKLLNAGKNNGCTVNQYKGWTRGV